MSIYTVAQVIAANDAGIPLSGDVIVDSAADIQANLDALQTLAASGKIAYVNFTDSGSPTITVTYAENQADATVIAMFEGKRTTLVTGATVAEAFQIEGQQHVALGVVDTEANIKSNIDSLSKIANEVSSITITDGEIPSFSLSQAINDSDVISDITVAGIGAAKAVNDVASMLGMHGFAVSDTAANISSNITGLEAVALLGKLSSITLTDGGVPTIDVSPTELFNDGGAIGTIQGTFVLAVDGTDSNLTMTIPTGVSGELVLDGSSSQYAFSSTGDGKSFTVTEIATGRESTDHLTNFAAVEFDNGGSGTPIVAIVASTTPSTAGAVSSAEVAALYAAVLGRAPDVAGLVFYENEAAASPSAPITQFALQFLSSPEYTGNSAHAYAQTAAGEAQFITDIYNNLLQRAPEAGAVDFYVANVIDPALAGLTPGTAAYAAADLAAHAQVLSYFSLSPEFRADVSITSQTPASASHWLLLI